MNSSRTNVTAALVGRNLEGATDQTTATSCIHNCSSFPSCKSNTELACRQLAHTSGKEKKREEEYNKGMTRRTSDDEHLLELESQNKTK